MEGNLGHEAYQGFLNNKCVTLGEVLSNAGYNTMISGKWHVGGGEGRLPGDRGFNESFSLIGGASDFWNPGRILHNGKNWRPEDTEKYQDEEFYMTDAISHYAIEFVKEYGKKESPFFVYLSHTAPHFPLHAWEEDIEKYEGRYDAGWDHLREERYQRQIKMGIIDDEWPLSKKDESIVAWEDVPEERKRDMLIRMQIYAAQVDRMDQGIGELMALLEEMGIMDNTLIIFLSDNGGTSEGGPWGWAWGEGEPGRSSNFWSTYGQPWANLSNTPFRLYKRWVHEGGIATPFIAHWPEVIKQKGKTTDQPGHIIDIMATFCEVAGIDYPETYNSNSIISMEGKSLLPVFKDKTRKGHDALFWEHHGNKAVRMGNWKLVSTSMLDNDEWHLYNLEDDRSEVNNLSAQHPEIVEDMKIRYESWADRCGVLPWPLSKQ